MSGAQELLPPRAMTSGSRLAARHGLHHRARAVPRPAVFRLECWQSVACGVDIELAAGLDDRRRIVHGGLTVERERRRDGEEHRAARETESPHCLAGSNDSVRLKNGITCSWKRTATSLVCVPG